MRRRRARFWWIAGALLAVVIVAVAVTSVALAAKPDAAEVTAAVKALPLFSQAKFQAHLVVPKDSDIVSVLDEYGISLKSGTVKAEALKAFRKEFVKRNPSTPNPLKLEKLVKAEDAGNPQTLTASTFMSLVVPMEFNTVQESFTGWDGSTVVAAGPAHDQIPAPGARDNNTVWYEDATPTLYNQLYFATGPTAGVVVHHPNLGTVDLRGESMANFYLEQSEGKYQPHGTIYPKWLKAAHSEAYYGNNNDDTGDDSPRAPELVAEAVDAINADNPSFNWAQYDGDGDGIVDNFTVIHAGMGEEAGGGPQGTDSIWSHASAVDYPTGKLACPAGHNGATRDIYVREYSMDPENVDVGVISEEYGHAAFGLPDIYTTDADASPGFWAIMEAGSWNGILGGMQPAPFPLYFRYVVGWAKPVELNYNSKATIMKVGQLSLRPKGTQQGVKINLPDTKVTTDNKAGSGQAWWSTRGDLADFYLAHDFDLTGATSPIFSFASDWGIEQSYDYGYVEVSTDGGSTWDKLQDTSGFMTKDAKGHYGLTGQDSGTLTFDLSAYNGKNITLRLHYVSDLGVQWSGWQADDFSLVDGANNLFTDDVESPPNGWTTNAFQIVPQTNSYPLYYLAEWRNNSGFDRGLKTAYETVYSDTANNEWQVDRTPYSVPGMLLWVRNAAYDFDYTLFDNDFFASPGWGPKHALLVVDSHYWPMEWNGMGSTGAHLRLSERSQPGDAAFTLQPTNSFRVRRGDVDTGDILETKTFRSQPPVSQFHDSLGYYPGLRYNADDEGVYFWDWQSSVIIPAKGAYTTKITDGDKKLLPDLFGLETQWDPSVATTVLGTGDPRDDGVQYGVNLAVLDKARDGSWGSIAFWNAKSFGKLNMMAKQAKGFAGNFITYALTVRNVSPAAQPFSLTDAIPANTTYLAGGFYNPMTKSIVWNGTIPAGQTRNFMFTVGIKPGVAFGTKISNTATLGDDANGDSATQVVRAGR
jgi:immune inhibitor A